MDAHRFARVCGLAALLVIALPEAFRTPPLQSAAALWSAALWHALNLSLLAGFCLACWRATRRGSTPLSGRQVTILLIAQVIAASFTSLELLVVVAAELPLVLPRRRAHLWLLVLLGTTSLVFVLLALGVITNADQPAGPLSPARFWLDWITSLVWQGFAFGMGALAAAETRQRDALQTMNTELAAAQAQLADHSRLAERLAIARELHDSVGHHLTAVSVQLELARQLCDGRAAEVVSRAGAMTRQALDEVRHVVDPLRRPRLRDLRAGLEEMTRLAVRPMVTLDIDARLPPLSAAASHALYRCAQEALTNAVRHSEARELTLSLQTHAGGVMLHARDNGRGRAALVPGHGIRGMRERLMALGGHLSIETAPGRGFHLAAWMPADPVEDPA